MALKRRGTAQLIFSLVLVLACSGHDRELILTEVSATVLPDSLDIESGSMLRDGSFAIISPSKGRAALVSVTNASPPMPLCDSDLTGPIAVRESMRGIEILDSVGSVWTATRANPSACSRLRTSILEIGVPVVATGIDNGWVILARDSVATDWIVHLSPQGTVSKQLRFTADKLQGIQPTRAFVTGSRTSAMLASIDWPFSWESVDMESHNYPRVQGRIDSTQFTAEIPITPGWIGLRIVALDYGFLQVLGDKSTERRAFVLYDENGLQKRVSIVATALGLLDADQSGKRLLLLRRTDRTELVVYEWAWGEADQTFKR